MNKLTISGLKVLKKIYCTCLRSQNLPKPECEQDPDKAAQIIFNALMSDKPCMIARFGANELSCLGNYIGVKSQKNRVMDYIKGVTKSWWWEPKIINLMQQGAGYFPARIDKIEQFCDLMIQDIPEVNILGSWLPDEQLFEHELTNCQIVNFELLNPYFSKTPWTKALAGKKVLVVHPLSLIHI